MRLLNDSTSAGGATPEVLEQLLGAKRGRSASSLDVKVSNGEKLIRPPKDRMTSANRQRQHQRNSVKGSKLARSGSGGKIDLSSLEGLSDDEILQVLQDDPELAAAAAAAAERVRKTSQTPPPKTEKLKRVTSEHPPHLKAMMDEGVPIKQWIVLLLLLAAGLYQLRKAIFGHKSPPVIVTAKRNSKKNGSKKKPKVVVADRMRPAVTQREKLTQLEEEMLVREVPVAGASKKHSSNLSKKKLRKAKVKTESQKEEKKPSENSMSHESPDSVSTDGSSNTDAATDEAIEEAGVVENRPVVKNGKSATTPLAEELEETFVASEVVNDAIETIAKPIIGASSDQNVIEGQSLAAETAPTSNPSKKKKKKKNNGSHAVPDKPATAAMPQSKVVVMEHVPDKANTLDDEALALRLQLEEEKLMKHEAALLVLEDTWEEVSQKRKKK